MFTGIKVYQELKNAFFSKCLNYSILPVVFVYKKGNHFCDCLVFL